MSWLHYIHNVIKKGESIVYQNSKPLTTNDWRTNGEGVVEVVDGGNWIKFTPASSKRECWTGTKAGFIIGETYRSEIEIGDSTTGSLTALMKDQGNSNMATWTLTANTAAEDNAHTFVATDTHFQQNIRTGTTGYVEAGIWRVYGPL
jgi:hypothetical protein